MPSDITSRQLSLPVTLRQEATLENFYAPEGSPYPQVLQCLKNIDYAVDDWFLYLWGLPGCGRSHLLQAACQRATRAGRGAQYLPLNSLRDSPPGELLEGMEVLHLVCLDELDGIVGLEDWENALFHLFNRLRDSGGRLLVAAGTSPRELPVALADLKSRLSWGTVFHLPALSDEEKASLLQFRAEPMGLRLADDVARFIVNRAPRDTQSLIDCLQTLDQASLEHRRRLTLPFVKSVFGW